MPQIAVGALDGTVVPLGERLFRAAGVHGRRGLQIALVGAADGDGPAAGQRQRVPFPGGAAPQPGVQLHQRVGPRELGGGEGHMVPFHDDLSSGRVGQAQQRTLQRPFRGRVAGDRADGAAAQQRPQGQREFGRVQGRPGGQVEHPGRAVHQVVCVGPLHPGVGAARFAEQPGQLPRLHRVGGAQQELVHRAVAERVRLECEDVDDAARRQGAADPGERAGFVPHTVVRTRHSAVALPGDRRTAAAAPRSPRPPRPGRTRHARRPRRAAAAARRRRGRGGAGRGVRLLRGRVISHTNTFAGRRCLTTNDI